MVGAIVGVLLSTSLQPKIELGALGWPKPDAPVLRVGPDLDEAAIHRAARELHRDAIEDVLRATRTDQEELRDGFLRPEDLERMQSDHPFLTPDVPVYVVPVRP